MKKLITILLAIILFLICVIGLMKAKCQTQTKIIVEICEHKKCEKVYVIIFINQKDIVINSTPPKAYEINKEFYYKGKTYYELRGKAMWFIMDDYNRATLNIREKTWVYKFKSE